MLYIIAKEGVKDEDRRRLLEHANISSEETNAITNLALLGVKLSQASKTNRQKSKPKDRRKKRDDEVSYDLSRYIPNLKMICQELLDGTMKPDAYPFVKDPSTPGTYGAKTGSRGNLNSGSSLAVQTPAPAGPVTSLRSTKPSWHTKKASDGGMGTGSSNIMGTPEKLLAEEKKRGGRIIIFVIGGITYSEIRAIYELGNASRKDIIIGILYSIFQ
jgi:syntaxin-binding protein 1